MEKLNQEWDEVLTVLSSHDTVVLAAQALINKGDYALAAMLLRDTLRTDIGFSNAESYSELVSRNRANDAFVEYVIGFPPSDFSVAQRLTTKA